MKIAMSKLLEAQKTLLQNPASADNATLIEQLRSEIPAPVLAHYLRLVAQGRRGVAVVNHGVCSQCHIRLPASLNAALANTEELHVCEQCGSFLVSGDSPVTVATPPPVRRVRKYTRQLAA